MTRTFECVLCGQRFQGFGNNAQPLANGRCCDFCDAEVLLSRIENLRREQNGKLR